MKNRHNGVNRIRQCNMKVIIKGRERGQGETAGEGKQERDVDDRDTDELKDERMLSHGRRGRGRGEKE